jgi:hypothetical protein
MAHFLSAAVLAVSVAMAPAAAVGHALVWDDVAACESSGIWDANTGNGFYGGLQIWQSTWTEHGGAAYAPRPDLASRDDQITVAEDILRDKGWEAWPDCSRQLGLSGRWHAVQPGDTLESIADRFQVPGGAQELQSLNPDADLTPGTLIRLP